MKIKRLVKIAFLDLYEKILRLYRIHNEINKFKDPRRRNIYNEVVLSELQKKQIDFLYKSNLGRKIPYTWHQHFFAFTGNFDVTYFPEVLFCPEFEHYMNYKKEYVKVLQDKNFLPLIAKSVGIKMPIVYLSCTCGLLKDENNNICTYEKAALTLHNAGKVFVKPSIDSCSGEGCQIIEIINGIEIESNTPIIEFLHSLGSNFVIQELLICSPSIRRLYPDSVNTFRIITYRWNDSILYLPIIMRLGQGGNYLDNAHAGGIFIAIDDSGTLHKTAFTEFKSEFVIHPDTKIKFEGYKIESFDKVISAAIKMHTAIPQLGCINWDFTINQYNEPVLIEANVCGGSIWLSEMAHGVGPFGDNTAEILRWLGIMEHTSVNNWDRYAFGGLK